MNNQISLQQIEFSWFLQHSNDLIIMLTPQGKIISISDAAAHLYHLNPDIAIETDYFEQLKSQNIEPPLTKNDLHQATDKHQMTQEVSILKRKFIIEWSLTSLKSNRQNAQVYVFLGKDITEQRLAEQQAKDTKLSLEHIVSCMPGNVYWMDKNLNYLGCNQNAADLMNFSSPKDIVGKTYEDFIKFGGWDRKAAESFKSDDLQVISTGLPKLNVEEPPLIHPNGEKIYYLTSRVPIKDENNAIVGVVGVSIDITKRKKMEDELFKAKEIAEQANKEKLILLEKLNKKVLGESAKRYETIEEYAFSIRHHLLSIIACMPGNVYWMDRKLVYLGCNNNVAKMLGVNSPEDIVGKTYDEMAVLGGWDQGQGESFRKDDLEVLTTGKPKLNVEEPPIKGPNGEITYFLTSRVPIRDENNNITGVVGISIDITELKKTQAELRKAEAKIEGMASLSASIAHELRTPLTAIQMGISGVKEYFPALVEGYIQAKEHKLLKNRPIQANHLQILAKMFSNIEAETQYSNTIINMILMNLKQRGISASDFKIISMSACIEEAIQRYPFKRKVADLIQWHKENDFIFKGDQMLMVHVLFNLLRNAIYYIEAAKKGRIEIWCETDESNNVLYFKDTAQGVPPEVLPKLFEKFYTTTRHGTGLGLAYCKTVMTGFGGDISCQSEYGEYTQFKMVFPRLGGSQ